MSLPGHDEAWSAWRSAMGSQRMHHAWMLAGRQGLGKMQFAAAAARELLGGTSSSIAPGQPHPDILVLQRPPKDEKEEKKRDEGKPFETRRNIAVSQIRAMQQRLTTRPTMGDKRVVIIDPADDLERSASNALLKSLEEPPQGTFFILVAHRPARLLPTIRSRCRMLRFPALDDRQVTQFLHAQAPEADSSTIAAAVTAASGSPGAALAFVKRDLGAIFDLMGALIREGDADFSRRGKLAELIGQRPDRDRVQAVLDLARAVLSSAIASAPRTQYPAIIEAHSELVTLTGQAPTYNFDASLLVAEIGSLLATAAPLREQANV